MTELTRRRNQTSELELLPEQISPEPLIRSVEDVIIRKKIGPRAGIAWIVGNQAEGKYFFGKQSEVATLTQMVTSHHAAGIEGGPGTGKTSILFKVAAGLRKKGLIKGVEMVELSTGDVIQARGAVEGGIKEWGKMAKMAILADGEAWENSNLPSVFEYLCELKKQGHYILIGIYGDYRYHPGINEKTRQACGELLGNSVVTNKLMSDEQVRSLISRGGKQIFSKNVEDYLIQEAGGHPYLSSILAEVVFQTARSIKLGWRRTEWKDFWNEVQSEVISKMGDKTGDFGRSVRYVREAGFDPQNGEFDGDSRINQEVYKNMLPRSSSTIFRKWLMAQD